MRMIKESLGFKAYINCPECKCVFEADIDEIDKLSKYDRGFYCPRCDKYVHMDSEDVRYRMAYKPVRRAKGN